MEKATHRRMLDSFNWRCEDEQLCGRVHHGRAFEDRNERKVKTITLRGRAQTSGERMVGVKKSNRSAEESKN